MNPENRVLLVCTNKLLLISIDVYKGMDLDEDIMENIQLNPMKFMKL